MSNSMLPEAVQIPARDAIRLNLWAGVAVLASFLSRWSMSHHPDWNVVLRTSVALAPILPSLLWAQSIARWVRTLDELQRRIQSEAWFFAAMGTVFALTSLDLLGPAGIQRPARLEHGWGWEGAFAMMFFLYCLGCVIFNRRYK